MSLTLDQLGREIAARLAGAGIEDARLEARFIVLHAAGIEPAALIAGSGESAGVAVIAAARTMADRRAARAPLSQVLGRQPFWTLDLEVTPDVLTPRSDTETVVHAALQAVDDKTAPLRILDIGTGSGAILLALLSELPNAAGIGTDLSEPALAVAGRNAGRCGLDARADFVLTRWADGIQGPFDMVVSNPPYIASAEIAVLDAEVRDHEPHLALDGGPDGLAPYPHLLSEAKRLLKPGGRLAFEIGFDQGQAALDLARRAGFDPWIARDLGGRDRVLAADAQ